MKKNDKKATEKVSKKEVKAVEPKEVLTDNRGRKAKEVTREDVNTAFNNLLDVLLKYNISQRKVHGKGMAWSTRAMKKLNLVKKQVFR